MRLIRVAGSAVLILFLLAGVSGALAQDAIERVQPRGLVLPKEGARPDEAGATALRLAVVAGVSRYPAASGFRSLSFADDDARDMAATLRQMGYEVRLLVDGDVSRASVEAAVRALADRIGDKPATVVFFFAGHGFAAVRNGQRHNYLAGVDALQSGLESSGIPLDQIRALLAASGARVRVLFIDACRNDPVEGERSTAARSFVNPAEAEGEHLVFSTAFGDVSWEEPTLGHGVFTSYLLSGMAGAARDADGILGVNSLFAWVREGLSRYSFESGRRQVPYRAGENTGDAVLDGACTGAACAAAVPARNEACRRADWPNESDRILCRTKAFIQLLDQQDIAQAISLFVPGSSDPYRAAAIQQTAFVYISGRNGLPQSRTCIPAMPMSGAAIRIVNCSVDMGANQGFNEMVSFEKTADGDWAIAGFMASPARFYR